MIAILAVGFLPNRSFWKSVPSELLSSFVGFDTSIAQATMWPFLCTFSGRLSPSAISGNPVTRPTTRQSFGLLLLGQAGGGVCLVLPRSFAVVAPAIETAATVTSAAHSAAKAIWWRPRRRRPVVDWVVPVIESLNTAWPTGLRTWPRTAAGLRCGRIA